MRAKRIVFMTLVAVVAIGGGGLVGMRAGRGKVATTLEIKPGIYGVKSAGGIYIYGARAGQNLILFDSGADPDGHPIDKLTAALAGSRTDVRDIFLTHGHFDHISGAASFSGVRTHLGAGDLELAAGTAGPDALATKVLTLVMRPPPLKITDPLTGAATIPVGEGKSVKALPVPGHTAGSYAFLYEGVLFTGDIAILREGRLETTPGLFDAHPEENRAAIRSLKTQLVADAVDIVCTAHGGCSPRGLGRNLLDDLILRVGG